MLRSLSWKILESLLEESNTSPCGGGGACPPSRDARAARVWRGRLGKNRKHDRGGHNPFKTKTKLGPGPRKGSNHQTHKWKCACATPYKCLCRAGKKKKTIRIKRDYKRAYNHDYKAWRKHQRS